MFRTTVDSVLRSLNKAITDLEVVSEKQTGIAVQREIDAVNARQEANLARGEAERAERVAAKLEELVS